MRELHKGDGGDFHSTVAQFYFVFFMKCNDFHSAVAFFVRRRRFPFDGGTILLCFLYEMQ